MKSSVKNFILATLIGSAILIAGFSADADGKSFERNDCVFAVGSQEDFYSNDAGKHNSEFWSKFRESVMPNDKNPSSDFAGNDNPEPPKQPAENSK